MTPATIARPGTAPSAPTLQPLEHLRTLVTTASATVASISPDDPRWEAVGGPLTAFVDAARRAAGGTGSPIRAGEAVAPVLRLRDLARLAQMAAAARPDPPAKGVAEAETRLRLLQVAALR